MRDNAFDICIIGGGASGMAAAVTALREDPALSVIILEKNDSLGRKIRATGSGRCNITNTAAAGYLKSLEFFRSVGLATREYPNGLVYPYSEDAADVAELLSDRVYEAGCLVVKEAAVTFIELKAEGTFAVRCELRGDRGITEERSFEANNVILACGGKAAPSFGTTGDGYRLARSLGHEIVRPIPILTQVTCADDDCGRLAGVRARGIVKLYKRGEKLFEERGEIQFTRSGLSGIAVFNMTRFMRLSGGGSFGEFTAELDLCPDCDIKSFLRTGREEARRAFSDERAAAVLRTLLRGSLAAYVTDRAGIASDRMVSDLTDTELERIEKNVRALRFSPTGLNGWKDAQCTAGGVTLSEVFPETCGSKLVPGLYITGELLDYDGPCGGFNLTNAWVTGMAAGRAAAQEMRSRKQADD